MSSKGTRTETLLARLPKGIELERVVRTTVGDEGAGSGIGPVNVLAKASIEGVAVALRVLGTGDESTAVELDILRGLDAPHVPEVVAHGVLESGGVWLAREWIEGRDLTAPSALPGDVHWARVFADIARALDAVHSAGLVHGDVAPANIVVDAEGRGWLTDFGFGRRHGSPATEGASGTPVFIAPERLVGRAPTPASDLFGLGATMAVVLARHTPDPARFYGGFPRESFLEAAGIELDALPETGRSLVVSLTRRAPETRADDASVVAGALESLAGGRSEGDAARRVRAPWIDPLAGRAEFAERVLGSGSKLLRVRATDPGEAEALGAALALRCARAGVPAVELELGEVARAADTSLAGDRLAAKFEGEWRAHTIFVVCREAEPWALEILESLAGAVDATSGARVCLIVSPDFDTSLRGRAWQRAERIEVPRFTHAALVACLEGATTRDERTTALADVIDRAAGGSSHRARNIVRTAARNGVFVRSPEGLRVAPAYDLATLGSVERAYDLDGTSSSARRLVAAVCMRARPTQAVVLARHIAGDSWERVLEEVEQRSLALRQPDGTLAPSRGLDPMVVLPSKSDRRVLHDDLTRFMRVVADPIELGWYHGLAGSTPDATAVSREIDDLLERGLTARVARGLELASTRLAREGVPLPASLRQAHVAALFRAGDTRAARRAAKAHASPALEQLVHGLEESAAGKHVESARTFASAGFDRYAALERAHAALQAGRALPDTGPMDPGRGELDDDDFEARRCRVEATSFRALALSRSGAHGDAIASIDGALSRLFAGDGEAVEPESRPSVLAAALFINRSTVHVDAGRLEEATADLEHALDQYVALGSARGIAEAQSQLGKVAKDRGELLQAEEHLAAALERRVRLGNARATALTRGVLGLVRSERGHLRAALDQLTAARSIFAAESMSVARKRMNEALSDVEYRLGRATSGTNPPSSDDVELLRDLADPAPAPERRLRRASDAARRGADRLAARYALAAFVDAAGADDRELTESARRTADTALARVLEGLTSSERDAALRTLVRGDDPRPADIDRWTARSDDDMDVLRILQLNERLVREESRDTLLRAIVRAALEVTGAERGFLVLEEQGELELETAFVSSSGEIEDDEIEWSRSIVSKALETHRPVRLADAVGDVDWGEMRSVESIGIRSILAAPFEVEDGVRGVVVVDDRSRPGAFGPREEKLLEMLAGQAALALRQVGRLEAIEALSARLRERVAVQSSELQDARRALDLAGAPAPVEGLVGSSKAMDDVRRLIHKVAPAEISVLVTGPSGSGKEVAARALHALSRRANGPFVSENCAALPAALVESELFGAVKGSYTGATEDRPGLFERASGGTLFLDEVGELPLESQVKLLRVLETRRVRRIGDQDDREVDFRLVCATNRDLETEVEEDRFRADLLFRIDGVRVVMPSLADRPEDIAPLVRHLLALEGARSGDTPSMSPDVLAALERRAWPGNVRQLSNEIRRLAVLSGGVIDDPALMRSSKDTGAEGAPSVKTIAALEREAILDAIERFDGDKTKAAEALGISRAKVYQRLKEWGDESR